MKRKVLILSLFLTLAIIALSCVPATPGPAAPPGPKPVLEKVKETGVLKVGFREAAVPFAYVNEKGEYVGFSVDMAKLLVKKLSEYLGRDVKLVPIAVEARTRVPLVANETIDISMECCTHTAARDEVVDFSLPFFVAETLFMIRAEDYESGAIRTLKDLNGKIVGATRGTTNLEALEKVVEKGIIKPKDLIITESHPKGFFALKTKKIDAYFTDSSLLMGLKMKAEHPENYVIIPESIHAEPYAFPVREGDSDFLDFVNNFIIWTLVTGKYYEIYDKWMGPESEVPIPRSPDFEALLRMMQWPGISEDWPKK